MTRVLAAIFGLCAFAANALGEWRVVSTRSESAGPVEHAVVEVENAAGGSATLHMAIFPSAAARLRVIDNASGDDDLATVMRKEKCLAGVNGGYFDPAFAPIGLRVIDGLTTQPLVRARLLTGVLASSRDRGVEILRIAEFSPKRKLDAAVECGPFLVEGGARIRTLNDTRPARRTFAAIARGGKAALGYCDDVTLAQLGEILCAKLVPNFVVTRALNLDGGSSSAFWCKRADGSALSISGYKSVRDFIAVVPRETR